MATAETEPLARRRMLGARLLETGLAARAIAERGTGHTGGGGTRLQLDGHRPKGVQPSSGRRLGDDLGYLELPHFASLGQEVTYVEAARQTIATVDLPATCGWVIDLRLNTGGGYAPMVTAAGPILGDGRFAGLRWSDGQQTWLGYLRHR